MTKDDFWSFDLAPIWSLIENAGIQREQQKRGFQSTRAWRGDASTHVPSIAGEVAAAIRLGQPMDAVLRVNGDDGYDLPDGTDVKTVVGHWPPILKHPVNAKRWPPMFALVYLDAKVAHYIGRVRAETLANGPIKNFGYGDNYTWTHPAMEPAYAHL